MAFILLLRESSMTHYVMTISRTTIDKLGIKLYDTAADAVSELISNSYDADAENVLVKIPLGVYLSTKNADGTINDRGYEIIVEDDGHGMRPQDINDFFLSVGLERRLDEKRKSSNVIGTKDTTAGSSSLEKKRPVTGRKGIGKLAPFGICTEIEVWSAGGKKGDSSYPIAHFILEYDKINTPTDEKYYPRLGVDDGKTADKRGTKIILRSFLHRKTPDIEVFLRQLARKFNLGTTDFQIKVIDTETDAEHHVRPMDIEILEKTKIDLDQESVSDEFHSFQVKGWIAYSKIPFQNIEMAGVRIYARGKLAAVTRDFGHKAGFTGEHTIRSYLVGEIHADWLDADDDEDLIASDRQDILWSTEKGQALQNWGQKILRQLGSKSVGPLNQRAYEAFMEQSDYEKNAKKLFGDTEVYESAMRVGKVIGKMVSMHNLKDKTYVKQVRDLAMMLAPHSMIVEKLREMSSDTTTSSLDLLEGLLGDTRLAEASSLGQVAVERINAINTLDGAIHEMPDPPEEKLQKILELTPWLIHAEWTVFQTNDTLENFRVSFEKWYKKSTGEDIVTSFDSASARKKPDFIMLSVGRSIEIIEIKPPGHIFTSPDFKRMHLYISKIKEYLESNQKFEKLFPMVNITLISDKIRLDGIDRTAFDSLEKEQKVLVRKTWDELLDDTKESNRDFLKAKDKMIKRESKNS